MSAKRAVIILRSPSSSASCRSSEFSAAVATGSVIAVFDRQSGAAFPTKTGIGWIWRVARGATILELGAAFHAKECVGGIIVIALRALHSLNQFIEQMLLHLLGLLNRSLR
jgi:hypothetical protein